MVCSGGEVVWEGKGMTGWCFVCVDRALTLEWAGIHMGQRSGGGLVCFWV